MTALFWVTFAVVWLAIAVYLARRALDDLNGGSVPGDDRWREFWGDGER